MNKTDFQEMPTSIVDELERRQLIGELRQSVTVIRDAVNALREYPDFVIPASGSVHDWQQALEAADLRRDSALKAIAVDVILTRTAKEETTREWKQWHKEVATNVNTIIRQLEAWPQGNWRWNDETQTVEPGRDLFDLATERSTKPVPAEATEHAELLDAVRVAVRNLRVWEDGEDVIRQPLETLLSMTTEELATQWATGSVKVNHSCDDPYVIANRELIRSKIF